MTANSDDIYIKADRNIEVAKKSVTLGDVLKIECVNPAMLARIRSTHLLTFHHPDNKRERRVVMSVLKVIQKIHEIYPEASVENIGETDIIGILTFFNHFGKKRLSVDPTPMEVEMRLYENDIQTTLVETYSRKEKELDVDEKHIPGNSGT